MSVAKKIEDCFQLLDQSSSYIAKAYGKKYLEALIDTAEQFFQGEPVLEGTKDQEERMASFITAYQQLSLTKEEIRRGMQLAILKGIKEDNIPGTGITPDSVAMLIAYLVQRFNPHAQTIFDPAIGAANLLTSVLNQCTTKYQAAYGLEVDPTLIRLAYANTNLQEHEIELYHQDALKPVLTPPAEITVCDLPIGLYPNEEVAKSYELYSDVDPIYTHHLLIEQTLRLAAEGGYLFFLIPNSLFIEPGAERLRQLITKEAYIQALLELPKSLFQEGSIYKSIFILQKKGNNVQKPKQTLIVSLPSFSNADEFSKVLGQINYWLAREKGQLMV